MSKAIKIIELLNKIANGEEVPKRIRIDDIVYYWDIDDRCYIDEDMNNWADNIDHKWLEARISIDSKKDLNKKVEIIEEESEIDISVFEELDNWYVDDSEGYRDLDIKAINLCFRKHQEKINELIKAVKQLDKRINNK